MTYTPPPPIEDPDYSIPPPTSNSKTVEHIDGLTWFAGVGKKGKGGIMFVSSCPMEEELDRTTSSTSSLLKGGPGNIFRRTALRAGIDLDEHYYTVLCKYCLSRKKKLKPSAQDIERCRELFEKELERRQPKIVVCLGKTVFDYFYPIRLKESEIKGGWFTLPDRDFKLFVTDTIFSAYVKPEVLEGMFYDLKEVDTEYTYGSSLERIETHYTHLKTLTQVEEWVASQQDTKLFSVDCEWGGIDYLTGRLRSIQFCWKVGHAVYLQFVDEKGNEVFTPEELSKVKQLLQQLLNRPEVKYIGHNFSADALWMDRHLGLETYQKCVFDTMYAMQTVDESYDLKLERLSIRFTDCGRYDIPLLLWKKKNANKMKEDGGYGAIPTEIMFPYGCADVDVPFRCYPKLLQLLQEDETLHYYFTLRLPFVTDGFVHMTQTGIPMDVDDTKLVRRSFNMVATMMREQFKERVKQNASLILVSKIKELAGDDTNLLQLLEITQELLTSFQSAQDKIKALLGAKKYVEVHELILHYLEAQDFNHNSYDHKARWLYKVKGLTPVKTTKNDGYPAIPWEKVEALSPAEQRGYKPSVDRETMQIFAEGDDDIQLLVELIAVNQIIKNFLKQDGEGLEAYIREDGRIHSSYFLTESGRPRSIQPNILNIPGRLADRVTTGFERVKKFICEKYGSEDINIAYRKMLEHLPREEREDMPPEFMDPVPLRWCFKAPDGYCFVDADFATAEVFTLAYLSNDEELIKALTEEDPQFVLDGEGKPVRVAYVPGVTQFTKDQWDPELLTPLDKVEGLQLKEDGSPKRPLRCVHWEMAENEFLMNLPREKLRKSVERDGVGKVGNFSTPYGGSPALLERMVEVATGEKPPEGTGENIIKAYASTKKIAWEYIERLKRLPDTIGYYQSPSGAKRHFHVHAEGTVSNWSRNSLLSKLAREAVNISCQGLVADYLAKAIINMLREIKERKLETGIIVPLYDALYTLPPVGEKQIARDLMQKHMHDENYYDLPGGRLRLNLEFEVTKRWGCRPTAEELEAISG